MKIVDISPLTLKKVSDQELRALNWRLHQLLGLIKKGVKLNRELIENALEFVRQEMERRKRNHSTIELKFLGTRGFVEEHSKSHNYHSSLLIDASKRLLIDFGKIHPPTFPKVDYVINTHAHPDHLDGLQGEVWISKETKKRLKPKHNIEPLIYESEKPLRLEPFEILPIPVKHSIRAPMHVFLIKVGNYKILYSPDILDWDRKDLEFLVDTNLFIIDGASYTRDVSRGNGQYGHASIRTQIKWYKDFNPQILITHCGKEVIEAGNDKILQKLKDEFPDLNVQIANDGDIFDLHQFSQDFQELAPINRSGKVIGDLVRLDDVLPYFKSFKIANPGIYLVGGLVNQDETYGDIDILINFPIEERLFEIIKHRLERMFPPELAHRLHVFIDPSGPFGNYIPLYSINCERLIAEKVEMKEKIRLFKFFTPPKPTKPATPDTRQTIEKFLELAKYPIFSSKKFDGLRVQIHKSGNKVKIFSDEGKDITNQFPSFIDKIISLDKGDFILDGEVEVWIEGKHYPREYTISKIHTKKPEDQDFVINIFDIPYYNGDITDKPIEERLEILEKFNFKQKKLLPKTGELNLVEHFLCRNEKELRERTEFLMNIEGSEGNVAKVLGSPYTVGVDTKGNWIKFKKTSVVYAKVIERLPTKTKGVYNYRFGVKGVEGWDDPVVLGKTFSTDLKFDPGDPIVVEIENLNIVDNEGKLTASAYAPRIIVDEPFKKLDTIKTLEERCKKAKILNYKKIENGEIKYLKVEYMAEDPYLLYPENQPKPFVLQLHSRNRSLHLDLRMKFNGFLIGWTIGGVKGLEKPPQSWEDVKNNSTKQIEDVLAKLYDPHDKVYASMKAPQPLSWMKPPKKVEPGSVGATKNYPGYFVEVDKGLVEWGVQEPQFHEYFIKGKKLNGRLIFRLISGEGLKIDDDETYKPFLWVATFTKELEPYILTKRALDKEVDPGYGVSALPKEIEKTIPEELRYWKFKDKKRRLEIRKELLEYLKLQKRKHAEDKFKLDYQFWKDVFVVRELPSKEVWRLYINDDYQIMCYNSPLDYDKFFGKIDKFVDSKVYSKYTLVKPQTELNPTKDTKSWIKTLDKGSLKIENDIWEFNGNKLKGRYKILKENDMVEFRKLGD